MKPSDNQALKVGEVDFGILNELTGYWLRWAQLNTYKNIRYFFFDEFDITPGLFGVLEVVGCNPGLTQTAVAAAIGNDRSAMVAIVDKLEKRGLIERKPSETDRRSNALFLTSEGRVFRDRVAGRAWDHNEQFFSMLSPEEHQQFVALLKRVALAESGGQTAE